ncbi:hypothetical protein GOODEAATRI_005014, partial [Goodea atripinnis]
HILSFVGGEKNPWQAVSRLGMSPHLCHHRLVPWLAGDLPWCKIVSHVTEENEELVIIVWPQVGMMIDNPMIAAGSTQCDIATMLPRDTNNDPLANHAMASPSPFGEIKPSFIHVDVFMVSFHGIQLKDSVEIDVAFYVIQKK